MRKPTETPPRDHPRGRARGSRSHDCRQQPLGGRRVGLHHVEAGSRAVLLVTCQPDNAPGAVCHAVHTPSIDPLPP
ncbi:MAG TPA: hypothetical protein DCQ52_08220 [Acidimicrobiaceae bacterium]|nr:hypothetical protein [Acidimicrobiaceae bacterium]